MIPALYGAAVLGTGIVLAVSLRMDARDRLLAAVGPLATGPSDPLDRRETAAQRRLEGFVRARGWTGSSFAYVTLVCLTAAVAAVFGWRLAGPVGGLAGLLAAPAGLEAWLAKQQRATDELAEEQLAEAVLAIGAGVRAGLSVRRALEEASREAEPPLLNALESTIRRLKVGEPLDDALRELVRTAGPQDAALVGALLSVHARTGGKLPVLLDEVADIVNQRLDARRQIRALSAQGRASGTVLAVLPVAFVILLSWASGDGLGAFYRTVPGSLLLLGGLVCEVLGFAWIRRLLRSAEGRT